MNLQQLKYIVAIGRFRNFVKTADTDNNGGFTIIPEMHLAFLSEAQRKNVRKIDGDHLSQRRISLYIREDCIKERMLNTIVDCMKEFMLSQMMNEGVWKYGVRL